MATVHNRLRNQAGFSLLEVVIAVTIMLLLITGFAVMITASVRILVFNQRNLQRMYTGRAVAEIAKARPTKYATSDWNQVDYVLLNDGTNPDLNILQYPRNPEAVDWRAMVLFRGNTIQVDVYAQVPGEDY